MFEPVQVHGESRMMISESTSLVAWDTNIPRRDSVLTTKGKAFAQRTVRFDVLFAVIVDRAAEVVTGHDYDHANQPVVRS